MLFLRLLELNVIFDHFANVVYHINELANIEPSFIPGNKSHLIVVCDSFNVLLNSVF